MSFDLQYLVTMLRGRLAAAERQERGASAVEWVVITFILVGIVLAVGLIIQNKITDKANSIDLG